MFFQSGRAKDLSAHLYYSDYDTRVCIYTVTVIIILQFKIFPLPDLKATQNIRRQKEFH